LFKKVDSILHHLSTPFIYSLIINPFSAFAALEGLAVALFSDYFCYKFKEFFVM
jgi:hypothetical protein